MSDEELKGAAQQAYGKARHKAGEVVHQAEDALGEVEDYVRANPLLAVGASIGIGLLLGVLIGAGRGRTIYVNGPRWPSRT